MATKFMNPRDAFKKPNQSIDVGKATFGGSRTTYVSGGGGGGSTTAKPTQTKGEIQALERVEKKQELTPVDVMNLRKLARGSGYSSQKGRVVTEGDINRYLESRQVTQPAQEVVPVQDIINQRVPKPFSPEWIEQQKQNRYKSIAVKQPTITERFGRLLGTNPNEQRIQEAKYSELQAPEKVVKLTYDIGGAYSKYIGTPFAKLVTGKTPSKESQKKVSRDVGTAVLFGTFSPLMSTGTYAQSVYSGRVVEVSYNGQIVKMTAEEAKSRGLTPITRTQALGEFERADLDRQVEIIRTAFKNRVYLDQQSFEKDLTQAMKFIKESGVSKERANQILNKLFPERFKVLTPIVPSKGILKPEQTIQGGIGSNVRGGIGSEIPQVSKMKGIRETGSGLNIIQPQVKTNQFMKQTLIEKPKQNNKQIVFIKPQSKIKENLMQPQKESQISKSILGVASVSLLKTNQAQALKQVLRQKFKQQTLQVQKQMTKQTTRPIKKPIGGFKFGWGFKEKLKKVSETNPELYEAFVDFLGKPKSIGKAKSKLEAESLLKGELKSTLRAGGFITRGGSKIRARELNLFSGGEFAISKINPFKVIQKKERRLGTRPETREIQLFKKSRRSLL